MNKSVLKCSCGQQIREKDVMQTGVCTQVFGPSFVYVRYRCSRCKRKLEQFVKQEDWDSALLSDNATELTESEKADFQKLGAIEMAELVEFHHQMEDMPSLTPLIEEFGEKPVRPSRRRGGG